LLTRSACHYAGLHQQAWLASLSRIVFLGTPHHGAPLERGGNWVDVVLNASPYTAPFAKLGQIRSAGITDLRFGNLLDEDWQGRDRFARHDDKRLVVPLPDHVACYAVAATTGKRVGDMGDRLVGDGLVPVTSALGKHVDPTMTLTIPQTHQWIAYETNHFALLTDAATFNQLRGWLMPT
jgi:hypothetical protein